MTNKSCPFCGGNNLSENLWSLDEGEADAIECNDCLGAALKDTWNKQRALFGAEWISCVDHMPAPGERVIFVTIDKATGKFNEPTVGSIVGHSSEKFFNAHYVYKPIAYWTKLPDLPVIQTLEKAA